MEESQQFPIVMRGYERAQVDQKLHSLSAALKETRSQVARLDDEVLTLSGELAPVHEPSMEPDVEAYVPWDYAAGYLDGLNAG